MFSIEREYIFPALQAAAESVHADACPILHCHNPQPGSCDCKCTCHVGLARLALSFYLPASGFSITATPDELRAVIGRNWVIARRSESIIARYGEDVVCLSQSAYDEAQRKAIRAQAEKMGVRLP